MITAPVKGFDLLRLAEDACNKPIFRLQIFFRTPGVLLRRQIDDDPAITPHFPVQTVPPIALILISQMIIPSR